MADDDDTPAAASPDGSSPEANASAGASPAPTPPVADAAGHADASLDHATASFDSVADATAHAAAGEGGSTPAIDEAALQELLHLANMDSPSAGSGGATHGGPGGAASVAGLAAGHAGPASGALPDAQNFDLPDFQQVIADAAASSIDLLRDVELNVKIELGRSRMLVEDVLKLSEGSVVELDKLAGDPVDVFVNERLVARGEVLVLNDNFCVRVNEIVAGVKDDHA